MRYSYKSKTPKRNGKSNYFITSSLLAAILLFGFCNTTQAKSKHTKPSIIALSPHLVEMLYSIGAGEQIIATTEFSDYPEAAKNIPRIGNYLRLQIERIIELQPDIIIAWRNGSPSDDLARLKKLGFNIIYSEPKTFVDIASDIKRLGKLSGHEKNANLLAEQFLTRLRNIVNRYKNKPLLSAFYELWSAPLTTIAKGSWPQQHLDICAARNVFYQAKSAYPIVGIEQVIIKNIDVIIVPLSAKQTDKKAYHWDKWQNITAVKNKQFIYPNSDKMHRMTLRALDELENLCLQLDEVRQFYKQ
jgi:vitamin B12 transport system substrate-binding protein